MDYHNVVADLLKFFFFGSEGLWGYQFAEVEGEVAAYLLIFFFPG
jgi:hypothetical protein